MHSYTLQGQEIHDAYRLIASHVYRAKGLFVYQAFDHINRTYFAGRIPEPLILWDITEHGSHLGWCRSKIEGPPVIKLHPSLLGGTESETPWSMATEIQGVCLAHDVLLHECMHVSVDRLLGGWRSLPGLNTLWTSHNNPLWIGECNRIAKILGFNAVTDMGYYKRKPIPGRFTKTGKLETKPVWTHDGDYQPDFFPQGIPGRFDFYLINQPPFTVDLNGSGVLIGARVRDRKIRDLYRHKEELVLEAMGANAVAGAEFVKRPIPGLSMQDVRCVFSGLRWQGRLEKVGKGVYVAPDQDSMSCIAMHDNGSVPYDTANTADTYDERL